MDKFIELIASLIPVVTALNGLGLIVKYVPLKPLAYVKNELIPYINTIVAFLVAFSGGATPAHAGVFGDIGHALGFAGKLAGSIFVTILARQTFEAYIRPLADGIGLRNNEHMVGGA